jgi:K+ transporter
MSILKYNNQQMSIFDFDDSINSRHEFVRRVRKTFGLQEIPDTKNMLKTCAEHLALFDMKSREFLAQCTIMKFDNRQMSEKQAQYLFGLYSRIKLS